MDYYDNYNLPEFVRDPIVSVLMITYNHSLYLEEAIRSVVSQETGFPFELVIGDDGSTDGTREIALNYQRRYPKKIRVLYSDQNVGWPKNNLRTFQALRGKYVAYCEGDDYWSDRLKLEKQVAFLEQNPEFVLAHSAVYCQSGRSIWRHEIGLDEIPQGTIFDSLMVTNFIVTASVCIRANSVEQFIRSDLGKREYLMFDYPNWLYAAQQGKIGYTGDRLATYRLAPGSLTHRSYDAPIRIEYSAREVRKDFAAYFGCSNETLERVKKASNLRMIRFAIAAGDRQTFRAEYDWRRVNMLGKHLPFGVRLKGDLFRLRLYPVLRIVLWIRRNLLGLKRKDYLKEARPWSRIR